MAKKIKIVAILMALSFFGVSGALAQQGPSNTPAISQNDVPQAPPNSPANCFDYYHFQSVQVSVGADKDTYKSGETVDFQGELINQNSYPVVDGYVFARIGRKNPNYTTEGNFTVDEFIPLSDINLDANETKPVDFNWTVPNGITSGDYRIDFFFSVGKKFNLGGLPFTNEIVIGGTEFTVNSTNTASVSFNKSGTKVNNQKYNHIGDWPLIDPGAQADIVQPLKNTYKTEQEVNIQYDLYFWDSLNENDKISSKQEEVTVPANGSTNLTYTVPQMNDSVYLLKITATAQDQKSIVNIRLTSNQGHAILNYPAITKFPLQKGDSETIFSCFNNTAATPDTSGQVSVVLQDEKGNQIGAMNYQGDISGNMMADKQDFTAENDYSWLKLIATLKDKNGKTVDQYQTVYDCAKINSDQCKALLAKAPQNGPAAASGQNKTNIKKIVIAIIIILLLISLGIIVWKKKRMNGRMFQVLMLLAVGGSLFLMVPKSEAYYDQTVTTSYGPWNSSVAGVGGSGEWLIGYDSILNRVGITQQGVMTAAGDNGYTVQQGSTIPFSYNPDLPFFFNVSAQSSSPYGAWCPDVGSVCSDGLNATWLSEGKWVVPSGVSPVSTSVTAIEPSNVSITSSNNSIISCSGMSCTASETGTAVLTANIPALTGKQWFKYQDCMLTSCSGSYHYKGISFAFPASSVSWNVTVTPSAPINNSQCISIQTNKDAYNPGETISATVVMQNTGTKPWSSDDTPHRIGSWNPKNNGTWGIGRVDVPSTINPGSNATFNFTVTAPAVGSYNFAWRTVEDGLEWFGDSCSKPITVVNAPTISGYVKKSTGEAIAGATIETCQGLVTTDSSGYWAKTVNTGSGYCARVASLPEAGATSVLTTNNNWCHSTASSYEWQVAGVMVGNCANSDDPVSWDRDRDSDVDFTVTATADAPAPPCTSNGCEANTCVGQTCNNGCVANAPGADNGSCNNGLSICNGQSYTGTCNKTCSGNKDCSWKEVAP
jgi:hypothetical protein